MKGKKSLYSDKTIKNAEIRSKQSARRFRGYLRRAGFDSYEDYLQSGHWKRIKAEYWRSPRPKRCFICDNPRFVLHHIRYKNLGAENLNDLLPLCHEHHEQAHGHVNRGVPYNARVMLKYLRPDLGKGGRRRRVFEFTNGAGGKRYRFANSGHIDDIRIDRKRNTERTAACAPARRGHPVADGLGGQCYRGRVDR